MNKTFLDLVNDVLTNLREPTVATWNESDYSRMIAGFVNRAKRAVENAWRWDALRSTFLVTLTPGTVTYSFSGTDERAAVIDAWNYTKGLELSKLTNRGANDLFFAAGGSGASVAEGSPLAYIPNGLTLNGEYQVDVWPVPDAADVLKFNLYAPTGDWTSDLDECVIPWVPIATTALARAKGERGEDGGIDSTMEQAFAATAAADAIMIDAARHSEELDWSAV